MSNPSSQGYDAIVVGAGPNGLSAAITLAQAGCKVLVLEGKETIGGGARTAELTLPGFWHDVCSAIHPLGAGSPFFNSLPLAEYGLEWIYPPVPFAHPLDDGPAVLSHHSIQETAAGLAPDTAAYQRLMERLIREWVLIDRAILGPLGIPRHPISMARFGWYALQSATFFARKTFRGERARSLIAGLAGHAIQPLEHPSTAAIALVEGIYGHLGGWPLARGGSQSIVNALAGYLKSLGGGIVTGVQVRSLKELPPARATLFDTSPRQLLEIAGEALPSRYRGQLSRYRYGPGVFKIDFALSEPIPWKAPECAQTATLHLGGGLEEIAASERLIWHGEHPEKPYVLLAQQSLFDPSRAPQGKHTAWAYCHVPNGSTVDMTGKIIAQIERFAPGFRQCILAQHTRTPADLEAYNPNYVGGDIIAGVQDLRQLYTRPVPRIVPYSTPLKGIYLCSASTPPGGGVHGMCGYHAARAALRACF